MSGITEKIAREHHIVQIAGHGGVERFYCKCSHVSVGNEDADGMGEPFAAHVAEVTEAAVRAGATVTPSREALIQAISVAESLADDEGAWALPEDVADAILTLLPGRSEAEVRKDEREKVAAEIEAAATPLSSDYGLREAARIARGGGGSGTTQAR